MSNDRLAVFVAIGLIGIVIGVGLLGRNHETSSSSNDYTPGEEQLSDEALELVDTPSEEMMDHMPEGVAPGEWVDAGDIRYRVICSSYGTTDYDDSPDVLQVNLFVQSQKDDELRLEDDAFAVLDGEERTFRQVNTYGGSHHFPTLSYEKLNPGTTKKYSLYFDVPGKGDYTFHSSWDEGYFALLKPKKDCLAELIESYDLSGIEQRLKSQQSLGE